jgi:hypothetical protein
MSSRFDSTLATWVSALGLIAAGASANATVNHSLDYANSAQAKEISISSKSHGSQTDKIFVDGLGREVSLRGFNVSGEVKLVENGFQPFANVDDAKASFDLLGQKTGSNMSRYTVAWEGIHPQPGVIDYAYLDKAISFMREAINNDIYVLVDYHSDLFSRHTFKVDSKDTGNGAPKWAVPPVVGKDDCSLPCDLTWSAHKLSDSAVRNAMKSFWYDQWIMDTDITDTIELYIPANNRCADIAGGSMHNSTSVMGYSCNGMAHQQWKYNKSGTLQSNKDSSKCLDVAGAKTGNNTDIQIYACNDSKAQKFIVDKIGRLHSALDFNKCIVDNSGNLALWDCSSTNTGQQFVLRNAETGEYVGESLTYSQTAFVWQIGKVAAYMKEQMTDYEFAHVLGFEPLNEPYDGGVGAMSFKEFDNQLIWPFYERVRAELDAKGINDKPVYAEPMVFWSSIAGITAPATGGHHLDYKPGDGFVFTPHFYDQGRMGVNDLSVARNGAHFPNLDQIRDEARFLNLATFLSEFGMWLDGYGQTDTERVVNGTYQGMESSDRGQSIKAGGKNRFVDFYTPLVSGAQWQWDYYYDNHHEYQNGNTSKLKTTEDAWNGENFSVINNYGQGYNVQANLVERSYPRAVQGEVMHFAHEGLVPDENNSVMAYRSIRTTLSNQFIDKEFFRNTKFSFLAWKGRNSDAPTEVYVPRHMSPNDLVVITEKGVFKNLTVTSNAANTQNEVLLRKDPNKQNGSGHVVTVWDDVDSGEGASSYHFTLVIDGSAGMSAATLEQLRLSLIETVNAQRSPVYLTTDMTHGGYPADKEAGNGWVSLVNQRSGKCLDVAGGRTFNGTNVQSYQCNNSSAQKWLYEPSSGFLRSGVNSNKCLDNGGQNRNNGKLVIWGCQNSNNMRWDFVGNTLVPRTNHNYAVDAYGTDNSSNVGIWSKHTGSNQQWVKKY